ncbi:tyrosine-type recombinase/integrase [Aureliella helgolandensis]|uniref:tyrosine-type recombinase/integrase n=1 Tax=Aureliella helgolandensis TaxID=2527968 RepID=UPI00119D850A|nr:site-specific integrase [Aureliella helgolandensis]
MASVVKRPNGHKWIQFTSHSRERKTIRLGKTPMKAAEQHRSIVEHLLSHLASGLAMDPEVARFIGGLEGDIRDRYQRCGLVGQQAPSQQILTLQSYLASYFDVLQAEVKQGTWVFYQHTRKRLEEYFGERCMKDIGPLDAKQFRSWLETSNKRDRPDQDGKIKPLSANTIRRRIGICKQVFGQALQDGLIERNPFQGIPSTVRSNRERQYYVPLDDFDRVLAQAPNARWKCLLVLARVGALRIPSEVVGLRWSDIAWERKRFTVLSPKTEHHEGHGSRVVPLVPAIEAELLKLHLEAPEGEDRIFPDVNAGSNLRTTLEKIIRRAGIAQWPKLWQNLRASGATDFARSLPSHVAVAICGHSQEVALEHYWTVSDADMEAAVSTAASTNPKQKPKQQAAVLTGIDSHPVSGYEKTLGNSSIPKGLDSSKWAVRDSNL